MRSKPVVKLKNWKAKLQKSLHSPEVKRNNNNKKNFGQMKKKEDLYQNDGDKKVQYEEEEKKAHDLKHATYRQCYGKGIYGCQ